MVHFFFVWLLVIPLLFFLKKVNADIGQTTYLPPVDVWISTYLPCLVNIVCERPFLKVYFAKKWQIYNFVQCLFSNAIYKWFFRHCQTDLAIPYGIACICNVEKCNGMNKTALLDYLNQHGHPLGFLNSTNQSTSPGLVLLFIALINQLLIL